jgi:hypothetical protein
MDALSSALAVLTAMITPAVLISASGTMILSTSSRLGRVVDRVRTIAKEIEQLAHDPPEMEMLEEKRAIIFDQLDRLTSRSRLLQRSLTVFYMSVAIFVATSVSIGVVAAIQLRYSWIPVILGLIGSCFLFYGSILMILEARLALISTHVEMDFLWRLGKSHVPAELAAARRSERLHMTFPRD